MTKNTRIVPDLIILRSTEGAGFPYLSQEAPRELVIDVDAGIWCVPKRSSKRILWPMGCWIPCSGCIDLAILSICANFSETYVKSIGVQWDVCLAIELYI